MTSLDIIDCPKCGYRMASEEVEFYASDDFETKNINCTECGYDKTTKIKVNRNY